MDYMDPNGDDDTDIDVQAAAATASEQEVNGQQRQQQWQERVLAFQTLLVRVVQTSMSQPDQVPSLVGQHMELILSILQPRQPYDMDGSMGLEFELESVLSEVIPNTFQLLKKDRDTTATTTTSTTTDTDDDDADEVLQQQIMDSLEFMFDFAESFVEELKTMDDANKQLLGKILQAATRTTPPPTSTTIMSSSSSSESQTKTKPNQQDEDI